MRHFASTPSIHGQRSTHRTARRHLFVPNFCDVEVGQVRITDGNRHHLVSGYVQRRPEELAVLSRCVVPGYPAVRTSVAQTSHSTHDNDRVLMVDNGIIRHPHGHVLRWFPREQVPPPRARYLDLILYSREQLLKEYQDMPSQVSLHCCCYCISCLFCIGVAVTT